MHQPDWSLSPLHRREEEKSKSNLPPILVNASIFRRKFFEIAYLEKNILR
jgi:hypothetical protein